MLSTLLHVAAAWPLPVVLAVAGALLVVESGTLVGMALPGHHTAGGARAVVAHHAARAGARDRHERGRHGRRCSPRVVAGALGDPGVRLPERIRRIAELRTGQAGRWLAERGRPATVLLMGCGHWAAAARPALPRVAGATGVPYRLAGPVLIVSGSAWAATLVLLGNRVGALVLSSAAWVPPALVALLIVVLVIRSRSHRRRRGASRATVDEEPLIRGSLRASWAASLAR